MKFELLLRKLKSFKLPRDQFAIMSSGVLAVRGLREARDIDIIVTKKLWARLSKENPARKNSKGYLVSLGEYVEAVGGRLESQEKDFVRMERQIKNADIIDGIRYVKLNEVKKFKRRLGRIKDLKDIKLIDNYLKKKLK